MKYRIMVIDDNTRRRNGYECVLSHDDFDPIYISTKHEFIEQKETPVDAYLIDVFLETGDWEDETAAMLLKEYIQFAPRRAPVFLVSAAWSRDAVLKVLKESGQSSATVVDYLAWSEFEAACPNWDSDDDVDAADKPTQEEAIAAGSRLKMRLLTELDRWHGRSSFRPRPDDTISILLLADMQFGDPETDKSATYAEDWIADVLRRDGINKKVPFPDLIAIAGDITYSGSPEEFAIAEDRLVNDLILRLWPGNIDERRDRLIVIPGNHDVNLRFSAVEKRIFSPSKRDFKDDTRPPPSPSPPAVPYSSHHAYALEPFRRFAYRLTLQREWLEEPIRSRVDRRFLHCGISFYLLNSVAKIDATNPDVASFEAGELTAINRSVRDTIPESTFNIAVSHHGRYISNRDDPVADGARKEKTIDNLEEHHSFFPLNRIKLWLFGHYHTFEKQQEYKGVFEKVPLWLVSLPTTRIKAARQGFCVLVLNRKNGIVTDAWVHEYRLDGSGGEPVGVPIRVFG